MQDLICISNAVVDLLKHADDAFIQNQGMIKGAMNLIDKDRALELQSVTTDAIIQSGGAVANSAVGFAMLGGKVTYIGKVTDDRLGWLFSEDMQRQNIAFATSHLPAESGIATAHSNIYVTPDGQRTMNTYLGACVELSEDDVTASEISDANILFIEGYLWDSEKARGAVKKSIQLAKQAGRKIALSLSDGFLMDRYRKDFRDLISNDSHIVIGNEDELISLYQTDNLNDALACVQEHCELAAITKGENGSVIVQGDQRYAIKAQIPDQILDTTGAGDMYAAGFLFGYSRNLDLIKCGELGSAVAAEVIAQVGARPDKNLTGLAKKYLG